MICTPAGAAGDTPQPGTSGGATAPVEGPALEAPALAPVPPLAPDAPKFRLTGCVATGPRRAIGTGPARKTVAIGFDDGPARITPAFVAMLEHAHARATFLTRTPDVRGQLSRTLGRIRNLTGYTPCVFRPPYGDFNHSVVDTARELGMATVLWDVDPRDFTLPGAAAIERRVLSGVKPGSIILSHDGGGPRGETLAAYPHIIAGLHARGYRIETIPDLLGYQPVYRPCAASCEGLGVARSQLPAGARVIPAGGP